MPICFNIKSWVLWIKWSPGSQRSMNITVLGNVLHNIYIHFWKMWDFSVTISTRTVHWHFRLFISCIKSNWLLYRRSARKPLKTHWGRVTHICVGKLTIIGSDNGLSPGRRQVIIWTNAGILLIGPLGTKFSEMLIAIDTFSFKCILNCRLRNGSHFVSALMCWTDPR